MEQLTFFYRTDSPFSFWYPTEFVENGISYSSAQQYVLHHKALLFSDESTAEKVLQVHEKKDLMKLSRAVQNFQPKVWAQKREQIAETANRAKFTQNEELKAQLLATAGTRLANANQHDIIWGIGFEEDAEEAKDPKKWRGKNLLGEILKRLREEMSTT
jgi:ribA/ribD-fused uncharacterized protein